MLSPRRAPNLGKVRRRSCLCLIPLPGTGDVLLAPTMISHPLAYVAPNPRHQNKTEEQVQMSQGTSTSSSYDESNTSTPSNLPKAATRARKKRTSDSEDEDYVEVEDEATSKKKVMKKEYRIAASTKPGLNKKAPARRVPTSKTRKAALEETMEFTLEPKEAGEGKKRKERVEKTTARFLGRLSIFKDPAEEEEEEEDAPAPKAQKLTGDAIKSEM